MKPTAAGSHAGVDRSADIWIDGARSDQKLAATMTPPVNPSMTSRTFRFSRRTKKTREAPIAVSAQVKRVAASACWTAVHSPKRAQRSLAITAAYRHVSEAGNTRQGGREG